MLLSMVVAALPTGAATTTVIVDGKPVTVPGNIGIATGADSSLFLDESSLTKPSATVTVPTGVGANATAAVPTVNAGVQSGVTAATAPSTQTLPITTWDKPWETDNTWIAIDTYQKLFDTLKNRADKNVEIKMYLTKDLEISGQSWSGTDISVNFILDGNGYAFKFTDNSPAVFRNLHNATIRNLLMTGQTITGTSSNQPGSSGNLVKFSPLHHGWGEWEGTNNRTPGKLTMVNVASYVNITNKNTDKNKPISGIVRTVGAGSTFTNVVYKGTVTYTGTGLDQGSFGGIVGYVHGGSDVNFTDCATDITMTVQNAAMKAGVNGYIGGMVGNHSGNATFTRCGAYGNVTVKDVQRDDTDGAKKYFEIGGFAGNISKKGTFVNCVSAVNYTIDATAKANRVAGMVAVAGEADITNCTYSGTMTVNGIASDAGGILGYSGNGKIENCLNTGAITVNGTVGDLGGVVGTTVFAATNCVNEGNITVNGTVSRFGGVAGKFWAGSAITATNLVNKGKLTVNADAIVENVSGISGGTQNVSFSNCANTGAIEVKGASKNVAGIIANPSTSNVTVSNCINKGNISHSGKLISVAGIIALSQNSVTNCVNEGTISITGVKHDDEYINIGGIVGKQNASGTLSNCKNTAAITVDTTESLRWRVGGILGAKQSGTVAVNNCTNNGAISVTTAIKDRYIAGMGGIVGISNGAITITKCENTANVTNASTGYFATGGILGITWSSDLTVDGCKNSGNLSVKANSAWNDGHGGIVGENWNPKTVVIKNCFNDGNITLESTGTGGNAGGILGVQVAVNDGFENNSLTITNCHNGYNSTVAKPTGVITIKRDNSGGNRAGGIVGCTHSDKAGASFSVSHCTNKGDIVLEENADKYFLGGISGSQTANTTITYCENYGDITTKSGSETSNIGGIAPAYSGISFCYNAGNINVSGKSAHIGGISGQGSGKLEGCWNVGNITTNATVDGCVAGLVGNFSGGSIINCVNKGNYTFNGGKIWNYGAIAGETQSLTVENFLNTGNVTVSQGAGGAYDKLSGLIGKTTNGTLTMKKCTNRGSINLSTVSGGWDKGIAAFVGLVENDKAVELQNCYNASTGTITVGGDSKVSVGAFVGISKGQSVVINNCQNDANITRTSVNNGSAAIATGGILGFQYRGAMNGNVSVSITNCTNNGAVTDNGTDTAGVTPVGGIAASIRGARHTTVTNCVNNGAISGGPGSGGWTTTAGIVSFHGSVGGNWLVESADTGCTLLIDKVLNTGSISGRGTKTSGVLGGGDELALSHASSKMEIKNAINTGNVSTSNTTAWQGIGGIVAYLNNDYYYVSDCANYGDITAHGQYSRMGGIVGLYETNKSIDNCYNYGSMIANGSDQYRVGGIIGDLNDQGVSVTNCTNYAMADFSGVDGASSRVGGIIGHNGGRTTVTNCTNHAEMDVDGYNDLVVGGIVGYTNGSTLTVSDSDNRGGLIARSGNMQRLGGIIGNTDGGTVTLTNSDNTGAMIVEGGAQHRLGGIVGLINGGVVNATNCDNSGTLTIGGTSNDQWCGIGAIAGFVHGGANFSSCDNSGDIVVRADADKYNVGGIFGTVWELTAPVTINNCTNSGSIEIYSNGWEHPGIGGIVGLAYGNQDKALTITGCTNNAPITMKEGSAPYNVAGIVASVRSSVVTIDNCVNTSASVITARGNNDGRYNGSAGILGFVYSTAAGKDDITIKNSVNYAKVEVVSGSGVYQWVGGIAGFIRATDSATIENCANYGEVIAQNTDAGGMLGGFATFGGGWMNQAGGGNLTIKNSVNAANVSTKGGYAAGALARAWEVQTGVYNITVENFVNDGDITSTNTSAGVIARFEAQGDQAYERTINMSLNNCVNYGNISGNGQGCAGILGHIYNKPIDSATSGTQTITVTNCVNAGDVNGSNNGANCNVGGVIGITECAKDKGAMTTITVSNLVNYGTVSGRSWNCSGIWGQNPGNRTTVDASNCINLGKLVSNMGYTKEMALGGVSFKDSYCYIGAVEKKESNVSTYFDSLADAYAKAAEICGFAASFRQVDSALALAEDYLANAEDYNPNDIKKLQNTYNAVSEWREDFIPYTFSIEDGVEFATQAEINEQYLKLVGTSGMGTIIYDALGDAIADADAFVAANDKIYLDEYWTDFTNTLAEAKSIYGDPDVFTSVFTGDIQTVIAELAASIDALEGNEGGYVFSEEDLNRFAGYEGTFVIMNDITVNAPIDSFKGDIYGNGNTVTLKGSNLFNNYEGNVADLTFEGNVEDSKAIFGNATGDVSVSDVRVNIVSFSSAVLFASAAEDVSITVSDVLATGSATALVAPEADIANGYLVGVEYYDQAGAKDAEALKNGMAAININEAFGSIILVQDLTKDEYPVVGTPAANGSNLVVVDRDGNVYNPFVNVTDKPVIPEKEPVVVPDPDNTLLDAAIKSAEAIRNDNYTAESWTVFQSALAGAKAVLADTTATQDIIDAAIYSLNNAISGLTEKKVEEAPVPVDYTALKAAIDAAKALDKSKYTADTWAVLEAVLKNAESALTANTQIAVNTARTAVSNAVLQLIEIPAEPQNDATEPVDEKGCGSVVGGAAIVMVAVLALGAGVTFKKKED